MGNYIEMKEELSKNKERLEIANKKSLQLDNDYNEIKQLMNNLKTTFTNKDKYDINKDNKDKFIQQLDSTNREYKKCKSYLLLLMMLKLN